MVESSEDFSPVVDAGFTTLHESPEPIADIIFVHGIQGHPYRTWAKKPITTSPRLPLRMRLISRSPKLTGKRNSTSQAAGDIFWPRDLLPLDCKNVRVLTWGYQSTISRFFAGSADKGNIFDHAKNLLYALHRIRQACPSRPIIFIAHSLGGIIVKETLRRSDGDEDPTLRDVVNYTRAVFFLGTPHRGSSYASLGETVRRVASAVGFDTNDANLRALNFDSLESQLSQEEFLKIWRKKSLVVRTFQESSGIAGIRGLTEKVVLDMSSSFGDTQERAQHIPGNHMNMCRFSSQEDPGYVQICGELQEVLTNITSMAEEAVHPTLGQVFASRAEETKNQLSSEKSQKILESLEFPEMYDRQGMISTPYQGTGDWLLKTPEYVSWVRGEHRFLWLKGKAGAGKSTLMKRTLQDLQYRFPQGSVNVLSYFFDASGTYLEKSILGLLRKVLYQLLTQNRVLLKNFVSGLDDGRFIKGKNLEWKLEELMEVFGILTSLESWQSTIIVVDALDESSRDQIRSLLFFFENLCLSDAQKPPRKLQLFLSSRHYPDITLSNCPEIFAEKHNQQDIEIFTRQKLLHLAQNSDNQLLVESILTQAEGVFLWVDLVTNVMLAADEDGDSLSQKLKALANTPHELDDLYTQIFTKLSEKELNDTFNIFKWVLYSDRRLSPLELCFALQFDLSHSFATFTSWRASGQFIDKGIQMIRFIRSRSRGLIEIRSVAHNDSSFSTPQSDVIQFIHRTVPEFLYRKGIALLKPSVPLKYLAGVCHHQIASTYINYLSQEQIISCASMTLLRFKTDSNFLKWIGPKLTDKDALKASKLLLESYNSVTNSLYSHEDLDRKHQSSISHATKLVFSELPLLQCSVTMLQGHLNQAEESSVSQAYLLDIFHRKGAQSLLVWYGFQDALELPRKHALHRLDWSDILQGMVALGLGSCIHELSRRVSSGGKRELPPACNLNSALSLAISRGSSSIAHDIIMCGADPNKRDQEDFLPLDDACIRADVEMIRMLIRNGAKVNSHNKFGQTPLHHAAKGGATEIVQLLVEAKADLESRIRTGETPLLVAVTSDHLDVVKLLITLGANQDARNNQKLNASQLAVIHHCPAVYAFLNPQNPVLPRKSKEPTLEPIPRAMTASPSPEKQREKSGAFGFYN